MARKIKTITIESGRDCGKTFTITEMPILQADKWAQRALFALAKGGINMDGVNLNGGMLEMAKIALDAFGNIDPEAGSELLDELLTCAQIVPSGGLARAIEFDSDIEDIKTLFVLRKEALLLHLSFLEIGNSPDLN